MSRLVRPRTAEGGEVVRGRRPFLPLGPGLGALEKRGNHTISQYVYERIAKSTVYEAVLI